MPKALSTRIPLVLAAIVLLAVATIAVGVLNSATAKDNSSAGNAKAEALANSPAVATTDPANDDVSQRLHGRRLAAVAADMAHGVPLPVGGSFDDIDWDAIGSVSTSGMRSFLEYNASCDWYRSWLKSDASGDTNAAADAARVIGKIPAWPSFRGSESGTAAAQIANAVAAGDPAPVQAHVAANCG